MVISYELDGLWGFEGAVGSLVEDKRRWGPLHRGFGVEWSG